MTAKIGQFENFIIAPAMFTPSRLRRAGFTVFAGSIYYPMMIWQYLFPHCDNCMSQQVKKSKIGWGNTDDTDRN
jgi:hypothetical protein